MSNITQKFCLQNEKNVSNRVSIQWKKCNSTVRFINYKGEIMRAGDNNDKTLHACMNCIYPCGVSNRPGKQHNAGESH